MKTKLSGKFWTTLVIFSLIGQVAWVVENMYFNVFIYKMFHATAADISIMVAASAVAATVTTLLIGALSDKIGKRTIFICTGYILWGITILGFSLIRMDFIGQWIKNVMVAAQTGVTLVIILDCIMTFFGSSANDACFNAWVTDKTDATNRGSVEGLNAMMPLIAVLVVFGGFMFFNLDKQSSWNAVFWIIGSLVIAIGIAGFFIIEEKPQKKSDNQNYFANILYGFQLSVIRKNPVLYLALGAFAVFGISIQTYMPYLILYYEKSLGMEQYVLIMAPAILLAALITAFYGRVYDRHGFQKSIIFPILILMLGYILLYLYKNTLLVFTGSLFMMTGYLSGMAIFGAVIRDYTPVDKTGLFQGLRIIGQVLIPGMIGPAIGSLVLKNAKTVLNSDGTYSFIPNETIFLAALASALLLWVFLGMVFQKLKREHVTLMTQEGEALHDSKPWQVYPRPQLKRASYLNLNGSWEFQISNRKKIPAVFKEQILVPFPPESVLSKINRIPGKYQYLYYRRTFFLPKDFVEEKVLLHFGAADQIAVVYVNGKEAGTHVGGNLPFSLDITSMIKIQDENEIVVQIQDRLSHTLPYGKQKKKAGGMWYTSVSGIWQTVWMESVPKDYIKALKITPFMDEITMEIETDLNAEQIEAENLQLFIKTPTGEISRNFSTKSIHLKMDDPRYWTPQDPYLYEFEIRMAKDAVFSYFALRTLTIEEKDNIPRLCLNGKPYFFHGLLDQGYFSDGIMLPASQEGYYQDIMSMKELGFNTLRKHIKVEPANFYYLCDKLGMAVFQDMVNNGKYFYKNTIQISRKYNPAFFDPLVE
ncbi:MAG: MFS transporter [Clostridiales bacterium]|nr:MFS transporter [Clostridiales bacterium]